MRASIRGVWLAAVQDVGSQALRSLISIAGMIAAIVAVIVVNAASDLSRQANAEYISWQYGRPASVSVSASLTSPTQAEQVDSQEEGGRSSRQVGAIETANAINESRSLFQQNGVRDVSVTIATSLWVQQGESMSQVPAMVVSPEYQNVRVFEMRAGSFPSESALGLVPHAVVSEGFARQMGWGPTQAIGQHVRIAVPSESSISADPYRDANHTMMIIDGVAHWAGDDGGPQIYVVTEQVPGSMVGSPAVSLALRVGERDVGYVTELFTVWARGQSPSVTEISVQRLDRLHELAPLLEQQSITARAVSLIAMFIGGLGILGVGLANVRQRASEFGIRRAVGASTNRIFATVILETLLSLLIGVAFAVPLAAIIIMVFTRKLVLATLPIPSNAGLPLPAVLLGIGSALVVGLVAGLAPAFRAARLSVVQALRD